METPKGLAGGGEEASPIGEREWGLVREAAVRWRKVKRAAGTARGSAIVTLVIGLLALPFVVVSPSFSGLVVVAGILVVGVREWKGYGKMRRAEAGAASYLGWNQVALVGVITFYCLFQMGSFSLEEVKSAAISPEVRSQLAAMPGMAADIDRMIERWAPYAVYGFYSLVILVSALAQGMTAVYYFSRRKYVETFNRQTPEWVRRVFVEVER
ncbi:MAG: hypothetical protein WBC39_01115 [Phycisphaerae bacterium]